MAALPGLKPNYTPADSRPASRRIPAAKRQREAAMLTHDQIESKLADLHLQRGHLASHGKDTSKVTAEIMRLHEEQATLADVEAAQVEQAREEQGKQHAAQVTAI